MALGRLIIARLVGGGTGGSMCYGLTKSELGLVSNRCRDRRARRRARSITQGGCGVGASADVECYRSHPCSRTNFSITGDSMTAQAARHRHVSSHWRGGVGVAARVRRNHLSVAVGENFSGSITLRGEPWDGSAQTRPLQGSSSKKQGTTSQAEGHRRNAVWRARLRPIDANLEVWPSGHARTSRRNHDEEVGVDAA